MYFDVYRNFSTNNKLAVMQTSNRVRFLSQWIPLIQMASYLDINRKTLSFYIVNPSRWRNYQREKIDELFEYVKQIQNSQEIKKMYFKEGCLISEVILRKKIYNEYKE